MIQKAREFLPWPRLPGNLLDETCKHELHCIDLLSPETSLHSLGSLVHTQKPISCTAQFFWDVIKYGKRVKLFFSP